MRFLLPVSWYAYLMGVLLWLVMVYGAYLMWWVPAQPFELHLEAPMAVNPATGQARSRWKRGDTFGVRFNTRILQDCDATYERWLRRADGLTYGPSHLGAPHSGHYRMSDGPGGRSFTALWTLPKSMELGEYAGTVRVTAHCSPLRATVELSAPFLIEVRR